MHNLNGEAYVSPFLFLEITMTIYGLIYETTYTKTGARYIGQTTKLGPELEEYFGSGVIIQRIQKKYKNEFFTKRILAVCSDKQSLNSVEKSLIEELKPELNISAGGQGGNLGDKVNQKLRENHADFNGENHPSWGMKRSLETRKKMSDISKGRKHTEEWKRNHSESLKGRRNPHKGKKLEDFMSQEKAEETKEKLRVRFSGQNNPMAKRTGALHYKSKKVRCIETGIVYSGIREAARQLNIRHTTICDDLLGRRKSKDGLTWEYV